MLLDQNMIEFPGNLSPLKADTAQTEEMVTKCSVIWTAGFPVLIWSNILKSWKWLTHRKL